MGAEGIGGFLLCVHSVECCFPRISVQKRDCFKIFQPPKKSACTQAFQDDITFASWVFTDIC